MAKSTEEDEVGRLRAENAELKRMLEALEGRNALLEVEGCQGDTVRPGVLDYSQHGLSSSQVNRYSRQLLLQDFGAEGDDHSYIRASSLSEIGRGYPCSSNEAAFFPRIPQPRPRYAAAPS